MPTCLVSLSIDSSHTQQSVWAPETTATWTVRSLLCSIANKPFLYLLFVCTKLSLTCGSCSNRISGRKSNERGPPSLYLFPVTTGGRTTRSEIQVIGSISSKIFNDSLGDLGPNVFGQSVFKWAFTHETIFRDAGKWQERERDFVLHIESEPRFVFCGNKNKRVGGGLVI